MWPMPRESGFKSLTMRNVERVTDSDLYQGFTVIAFPGESDAYTAPRVRSDLATALGAEAPLVVDLSQATFIDSTIVGVLLESLAEYEKPSTRCCCSSPRMPRPRSTACSS